MNKKSYLYISPSIFIWEDQQHLLFYSSETKEHYYYPRDENVLEIVRLLQEPINLHCVPVNTKRCQSFLEFIKKNGIGKIINCAETERPLAIPPFLCFPKKNNDNAIPYFDLHSVDYIKTATVHLSCVCNLTCPNCDKLYKQTYYCCKSDQFFSAYDIKRTAQRLQPFNLRRLNIIISGSPSSEYLTAILDAFNDFHCMKMLYIHWKNIPTIFFDRIRSNHSFLPIILVDISTDDIVGFNNFLRTIISDVNNYYISFCVSSESDLSDIEKLTKKNIINDYDCHCFYNGHNMQFLTEYYYLSEDELKSLKADINMIYSNQVLNLNFYGELIIHHGNIYYNENTQPIGSLDKPMQLTIQNSFMSESNAWLYNRSAKCYKCSYKYLCPPIGNLELYMHRDYACTDYHKKVL